MKRLGLGPLLIASLALSGCEDAPPSKNPFDPAADAPKKPPAATETPEPEGPPDFNIDTVAARVSFEQALLDKDYGREDLVRALSAQKKYIDGREVKLRVDRKAKIGWVITYIDELAKLGATKVLAHTPTRKEFLDHLPLVPRTNVSGPPGCSVVAMVLEDRSTAVWRLKGGTASRRGKGMAGPDLTLTGDTITRLAKNCEDSDTFFFSAAEDVEWGLAYDLAASTRTLKAGFRTLVLLGEPPVPGHRVEL